MEILYKQNDLVLLRKNTKIIIDGVTSLPDCYQAKIIASFFSEDEIVPIYTIKLAYKGTYKYPIILQTQIQKKQMYFKQINESCLSFAQSQAIGIWENITSRGYNSPTAFKTLLEGDYLTITLHNSLPDYAWEAKYKEHSTFLSAELAKNAAEEAVNWAKKNYTNAL